MENIKRNSVIALFILIGISLLIWTFKQISFEEIKKVFFYSEHKYVLLFVLFSFLIIFLHTYRWKIIIGTVGHNISIFKLLSYKIAGMSVSFITPGAKVGGEPVRAMLLQKHGIEFHKGLSTVITDKIVDLSSQGVLFVVAAIVAITTVAMPKDMLILLIITTLFFAGMIIYVYYQIFNDRNLFLRLFRKLKMNKLKIFKNTENKIIEFERIIVKFHKEDNKEFYLAMIVTMLAWILMFGEYYFALMILNQFGVSVMQVFMIITMMGAAYLMPVPMALGVFEAGQVMIFKILGLGAAVGIGLAMVIRARDTLICLIGLSILGLNGLNWKTIKKKEELF